MLYIKFKHTKSDIISDLQMQMTQIQMNLFHP